MLRSESLAELPDARIEDDFAEMHRAVEQLEVERLRRLAEIDRRKLFERDGHLSTASWLVSTFKVAWGVAREQVRLAKALEQMPVTRAAVEEGEVSLSSARVLATAHEADAGPSRALSPRSWTRRGCIRWETLRTSRRTGATQRSDSKHGATTRMMPGARRCTRQRPSWAGSGPMPTSTGRQARCC
jgi:hypothetical protein